jgi:hypothetical protein
MIFLSEEISRDPLPVPPREKILPMTALALALYLHRFQVISVSM